MLTEKYFTVYRFTDAMANYKLAKHTEPPMPDEELYEEIIPACHELLRMCEDHPLCCRRTHIMDHYRIDTEQSSCGTCDICTADEEHIQTLIPVKAKHIIKALLDTLKNMDLMGTSAYFTQLSELATKTLKRNDKEVKDTYSISQASFGSDFGISYNDFCKAVVEKTIVYLILEGVIEERYEKSKDNFYLQVG